MVHIVYGVKDRPGFGKTLIFALQQLLAILAATIAVPAIVGHGMSAAAALLGAGVGTLVYLCFTKFKSPVFLGSSFAFIGSMSAAFAGAATAYAGYAGLIIGAVLAGLVYVIISLIVKKCGTAWIDKLMPAVVIGPTVAIIGLSLASNAIGDLVSGAYYVPSTATQIFASEDALTKAITEGLSVISSSKLFAADGTTLVGISVYYNTTALATSTWIALLCGLVTLLVTVICSVYGNKFIKTIPFVIGIASGYVLAAIFTGIGYAANVDALKVIDFTKFQNIEWYPSVTFLKAFQGGDGFANAGEFWSYFGTVALAYVPVAFVVFAEHIADHKNLSSVIDQDLLKEPGLHRTLLGDGVGSMAGAFFGGCPNTTYGESVGCVAITGNASVITIVFTAFLCIILSFIGPFSTFLATIPPCVMGGVCIALYGFIAVSGLKMIQKSDLDDKSNLFTVSAILIAGIGGLALTIGSVTITSVACALILGIIVNKISTIKFKKKTQKPVDNQPQA